MIVVDASVLVTALIDDGDVGTLSRNRLANERLIAPELIDLEVTSALRRLCETQKVGVRRAEQGLADLRQLRLRRCSHIDLLTRCWHHRHNLTTYDAAYVALAELTSTTLLTADKRLAQAPALTCEVELLT